MSKDLEKYFSKFKENIVGNDEIFETSFGKKKMIYADWVASGRLYLPIEEKMRKLFGPMIGNTHAEASATGITMTRSYFLARQIIKQHVNASEDDILLTLGSGMTRVLNKFQQILGLRLPDRNSYFTRQTGIDLSKSQAVGDDKPIVFVSHIEHHSNHFSWLETIADVVMIEPNEDLSVSTENLKKALKKYETRKIKIGSFSSGSNVTGYMPNVHEWAKIMHQNGGLCFVDYAATAPYIKIDMHPEDPEAYLDAIFFSPHKFVGGPGSAAVLVFNKKLYKNIIPTTPGGGTVLWTNPWNECRYTANYEVREDGGTPAFTQTIRTALAIKVKEEMGHENIMKREEELIEIAYGALSKMDTINVFAPEVSNRLGVVSFCSTALHHNLIVKILNDRYGIQTRGGCACAGPYGHYLLNLDREASKAFSTKVDAGNSTAKPGWVRISLHPTMTNDELDYVLNAVKEIIDHAEEWGKEYHQVTKSGEWFLENEKFDEDKLKSWFEFE